MSSAPSVLAANSREVRRLRLRLADEDSAQRARIAIEDGLATADFGDYGRLILIRRMALSRFAGDMTGPAAARAIEVAFRALLPHAVHASEPHAAEAPVVWFVDRLEAFVEALSLRAHDRALDGWYWRKVDPLLSEATPDIAAVFGAIVSLSDASTGPDVVIRALVHRWRSWTDGAFCRFLAAVPEQWVDSTEDGTGVTHIYGVGRRNRLTSATDHARRHVAVAAQVGVLKARWVAYCELVALDALSADSPPSTRASRIDALVEDALLAADGKHAVAVPEPRPAAAADDPETSVEPRRVHLLTQAVIAPRLTSRTLPERPELLSLALPPWLIGARSSAHGGFFMLLNAWRAVGFHEWIAAHPRPLQSAICRAWLERWSARFCMSEDDAQRLAWRSLPECDLQPDTSVALAEWMTRTRRWLRTQARIGPASLVFRVGAVAITRTHIDVAFSLSAIDVRARRAGLDQDPGWVPWLGRIVTFLFVETEVGHA